MSAYVGSSKNLKDLKRLSSDNVYQETSARYRAVEPGRGSNVIPKRARPGLASLKPCSAKAAREGLVSASGYDACCCGTGVPRSQENASPQDPTVGLCLGPYGGPRGGGVFFTSEVSL